VSHLSTMLLLDNQAQLRQLPEFQGLIRFFGPIPTRRAVGGLDYETMWTVFNCYATFIHIIDGCM